MNSLEPVQLWHQKEKVRFFWVIPSAFLLLFLKSTNFLSFFLAYPGTFSLQGLYPWGWILVDFLFVLLLLFGSAYYGKIILNKFRFLPPDSPSQENFLYHTVLGQAMVSFLLL